MDESAIREVVGEYFDRLNHDRFDELVELFAPDAELRAPGFSSPRRGHEELRRYYETVLRPYPEHWDEPVRVVVADDMAFVDIHYDGRLPNGQPLSFDAHNVYELSEGRIERLTSYYDSHAVHKALQQAKAASGPEQ